MLDERDVNSFNDAVKDVLDKIDGRGARPGYARAVLLCNGKDAEGMDDELANVLTACYITLSPGAGRGEGKSRIQLVVDEEEMYTVIPFLPEQIV